MKTPMQHFADIFKQDQQLQSLIQHLTHSQLIRFNELICQATGIHAVITISELSVKEFLTEQSFSMPSDASINQACKYVTKRSSYQDTQWYGYIQDAAEHALSLEEVTS